MINKRPRNLIVPIALLLCAMARAQPSPPAPAPVPAKPEEPKDPLGRSTPRGTVLGLLNAARRGDDQAAVQYLNTRLRGKPAASLAQQLYAVLDRHLPARIDQISDRPEGSLSSLSRPNQNVIGTIAGLNGQVEIAVDRISVGAGPPLWLFSRSTLDAIPELYDEINAIGIEEILPAFLVNTKIAGISLYEWIGAVFGIPFIYGVAVLVSRCLIALAVYLLRRFGKEQYSRDARLLPSPLRLLAVALLIQWVLSKVNLPFLARQFWSSTAIAIAIVAFVWLFILLNARIEIYVRRRLRSNLTGAVLRFARRTADALGVVAGILASLHFWGVSLTGALAGLGVGGIAVALAAQKTLENVIGGIALIFDRALNVGDSLKWGDIIGTVEDVGMRSTRIRTLDRTVLSVPNGQVSAVPLENLSARDKFWFHPMLRLRYDTTAAQMRSVLQGVRSILGKESRIEHDSVRVRFLSFGVSSLDIEVFAYLLTRSYPEFLEVQERLLFEIMEAIQAAGTSLALPSQTMYLNEAATAGAINQERKSAAAAIRGSAARTELPPAPAA